MSFEMANRIKEMFGSAIFLWQGLAESAWSNKDETLGVGMREWEDDK